MIRQHIVLGKDQWDIIVYYNIDMKYKQYLSNILYQQGCSNKEINESMNILSKYNTGITYTNMKRRISIVFISKATSNDQFINTIIHEAKHVQTHVCDYYNINEDGETAAYLIGYIVQQMYKIFKQELL